MDMRFPLLLPVSVCLSLSVCQSLTLTLIRIKNEGFLLLWKFIMIKSIFLLILKRMRKKKKNTQKRNELSNQRINLTKQPYQNEQVMRGHNIVANRWAGASNPRPHPTPIDQGQKCSFSHFSTGVGPTDRRTNQRLDKATDWDVSPQLETISNLWRPS